MLIDEIEKNKFHKNENFKTPWLNGSLLRCIFVDINKLHKYKTSESIQNISFLLPMLLPNPCGNPSNHLFSIAKNANSHAFKPKQTPNTTTNIKKH